MLGVLHFETTSKASFRKLVRDEESKLSRTAGWFERVWVSLIREKDSASEASSGSLGETTIDFICRWKVDGFVYQLSSGLITKNSPKAFKQIDAWCYAQKEPIINMESNRNITAHVESFAAIDALFQNQIAARLYNKPKTLNLTTNVFYLIKDSYSIIKGLSDLKASKTMAILELLDHTRLLSPGEVMKGVK